MSRICPLFSGSTGNSTYIHTSEGGFLIDAGASYKSLVSAVEAAGGNISDLRGIAVTHEHIDHIKGLKTLLKNCKIPVIASSDTLDALISIDKIPSGTQTVPIDCNTVSFGNLEIERFSTQHDCKGSSGYTLTLPDGKRAAVCTDLGIVTEEIRNKLAGCDLILLESNHDIRMLENGPYPPSLKLRILSDYGHLSNTACSAELPRLLQEGCSRFILGHISLKNNLPMLAVSAAKTQLMGIGAEINKNYLLYAARPSNNEVFPL